MFKSSMDSLPGPTRIFINHIAKPSIKDTFK